jgi:alpha-beta hydrolase superfamily lysophospholipase
MPASSNSTSTVDPVETQSVRRHQRIAFTFALRVGSRAIYLRDKLLGRIPRSRVGVPGVAVTPLTIPSGNNLLDAIYAAPSEGQVGASVLICHGIGEVVSQWAPIQGLLAARGVASLVFDYSGYGRSTGQPAPAQLEHDAIASFATMRELTSGPISLLGFSLGTGIVAAILDRVPTDRLVLCAAFTSFRAATRRVGIPRFLSPLIPAIWDAQKTLRSGPHRVLLVHSTGDRLFPITMAEELAACCGPRARLHMVEGLHHNEPFYKPTQAYWDPIAEFLASPSSDPVPCERS